MQHMDLQGAEAAAEIDLLLWRNVLIAEHQHMMVEMGVVHALEIAERQGLRQIQSQHLCTQGRIEGFDLEPAGRLAGKCGGFEDGRHDGFIRERGMSTVCLSAALANEAYPIWICEISV